MTGTAQNAAPELKSSAQNADDVAGAFDDFMEAFDAFKQTNDDRLGQIEKRMSADVLTVEKVERISKAMDEHKRSIDQMLLKKARPQLGREASPLSDFEHKRAFDGYMRRGDEKGLAQLEAKSLSAGIQADGGYVVPTELEAEIGKRLSQLSPIRAIASVRQMSASVLRKPFALTGFASGWTAETGARTQTTTPTLTELQFPAMELYAMPAATQTLLDDSAVDIDSWIAQEVEVAFAEQEGAAFVNGDAVNKPRGFLNYPTRGGNGMDLGQSRLCRDRRLRRAARLQSVGCSGRHGLRAEGRLPPERVLGDEPQDAGRDPQAEGCQRRISVAAVGGGGRQIDVDGLQCGRGRGHAEYRRELDVRRVRRFLARLSGG